VAEHEKNQPESDSVALTFFDENFAARFIIKPPVLRIQFARRVYLADWGCAARRRYRLIQFGL
jgi:hypothetical protein